MDAHVGLDAVDFAKLSQAQELAAAGLPAAAMAGYLRFLAADYEAICRRLPGELAELRAEATRGGEHRRTPMVVAQLALGLRYLFDYADAVGAISAEERTSRWARAWEALGKASALQDAHQAANDPVRSYRTALVSALTAGQAHVSDMQGDPPKIPFFSTSLWGWRKRQDGGFEDWRPQGDRIGWIDGEDLFLDPKAAFATGAIIWARPGRNAATLQAFFDELGERKHSIRAVSIDMSAGYENAVRAAVPDAEVCFDPFHVVKLANEAVSQVRRADWNAHAKSTTSTGRWLKGVRWALLKAPERLTALQQIKLAEVQAANRGLYRAYLLKEELRALYHLPNPALAPEHLAAWLGWASRSKLKPFVKLARTIRRYRHGILAAIRLGHSNARLEGLNSKVRLISHRSFGLHGPDPLIALIYLCAGRVRIDPAFTTNS